MKKGTRPTELYVCVDEAEAQAIAIHGFKNDEKFHERMGRWVCDHFPISGMSENGRIKKRKPVVVSLDIALCDTDWEREFSTSAPAAGRGRWFFIDVDLLNREATVIRATTLYMEKLDTPPFGTRPGLG